MIPHSSPSSKQACLNDPVIRIIQAGLLEKNGANIHILFRSKQPQSV
ncbi:hypothetical protein E6C60_3573 [Paenibacillus algicola]|uniref:Uncharacterized protein n=1 Tax=Paenibacillus algicola TaxID=2565926 RepID=A0A4P8XP72_9BACL|nr:hypothetical protein E6C60_3573 [Paenibacillus algicola]